MFRNHGSYHNIAAVVATVDGDDNATNEILNSNSNDVLIPQECNSCNNQSNVPHAIQITR